MDTEWQKVGRPKMRLFAVKKAWSGFRNGKRHWYIILSDGKRIYPSDSEWNFWNTKIEKNERS